ncbi:hypothetical protein HU200_059364 [Digitaria exilis]|uniref:Disease resistance N-terminal domain-containing protein n=1 Tax=Digitaria exilis TaxID=1010633 RepID=A0A835A8Y6_9POAL|nr:hypothetical protein HU200_059364 [Digitaria exilis]
MADSLFVVLRKVALSLGECVLERIGTEVAEVAPILTDFEHSLKQIEGELSIMKAFIDQVGVQRDCDKAFDAWLDQVIRDVAHEVEDIIDEYAYLTAQAPETSSFFKRKFHQIKNFASWQKLLAQISQVEARIQRLGEMRNRYGISVTERNGCGRARTFLMHDLVRELGSLSLMRGLGIMEVQQSYVAELWNSLTRMPNLSRLLLFASDMDEILSLKMLKPLPNLKLLWLAGKLDGGMVPSLFSKFEKLTQLKMDWSGLEEDPISSFSHMLNLVNLCLVGAYIGEQLTFRARWFPKLKSLQIVDMEHLNLIEIEDGTLMSLHILEFTGLRNLKAVPEGIKYIRTVDQMFLTDMSNEFTERLLGSDNHIVQHIIDIRNFGSSDSPAANNFISSEYLVKKYGAGAIKNSPVE